MREKERGAKSEGRQKESGKGGEGGCLFSVSKGAAFPKVPGATLQHLGSPRPFGCLLIANPHLCHMARWWDASPCSALHFFFFSHFFSECTSTQVRMAELPGNSQKPLAFGTICPAAFLLSLIRKEWGWMQSTSSPLDVMRLCKLVLLYSFSSPSFPSAVCSCSLFAFFFSPSFILCLFSSPHSLFRIHVCKHACI